MSKQNPSNSGIIQYLLDMSGNDIGLSDSSKTAVQTLLKELQHNQTKAKTIDDKFRKHDVPEQSITYTQDANLRKSKAFISLNGMDIKAFDLLKSAMTKDGLVEYNRTLMSSILGVSHSTLKRSIKTLVSSGFIAYFKDPSDGRGHPILMINPKVAFIGTLRSCKEMESKFSALAGDMAIKAFNDLEDAYADYTQGYMTYQKPVSEGDNKTYKIGVITQQKEPVAATTTDPHKTNIPDGIDDPSLPFNT